MPPLCSAGISIVYGQYAIANGAALLFMTNLVAIVLGAAATFWYLGVTEGRATAHQRRWVYKSIGMLGLVMIALAIPLENALDRNIEQGKPQPANYPLTKAVEDAVVKFIKGVPDAELIAAGRPSSLHRDADVIIIVASPRDLPESFGEQLVDIVHKEMGDDELIVEVHCLQEAWKTSKRRMP